MHCKLEITCDSAAEMADVAQALAWGHTPAGRPGEIPRCARCGVFVPASAEPCQGRAAPAALPIPATPSRDGVAGMLARLGWGGAASRLLDGGEPMEVAADLRKRRLPDPDRDACTAALEALAAREACRVGHGAEDACAECAPGEQPAGRAASSLVQEWRDRANEERQHATNKDGSPLTDYMRGQRDGTADTYHTCANELERRDNAVWRALAGLRGDAAGDLAVVAEQVRQRAFAALDEVETLRKRVEDAEFTAAELTSILRDVRAALGIQSGDSVTEAAGRSAAEANKRKPLEAELEQARRDLAWERSEADRLRKGVAYLEEKLAEQHEAHRDAVWEVKGILGAPSVESLKTHAEKVKEALMGAVADARENKDALERAAAEQERLRARVAYLELKHDETAAALARQTGETLPEAARRVARAASFNAISLDGGQPSEAAPSESEERSPVHPLHTDETAEQIAQHADQIDNKDPVHAQWLRGVAAGLAEGERRAKAKAAEILTSWEAKRAETHRLRDESKYGTTMSARRDTSALIRRSCMLELSDAFDVPLPASPTDPGQPPTGGEPGPEEPEHGCGGPREACAQPGCDECGTPPADTRPRLAVGQRWRDAKGRPILMQKRDLVNVDALLPFGQRATFREGEKAPEGWMFDGDPEVEPVPPADADERWQPGAVWSSFGVRVDLEGTSYGPTGRHAHFRFLTNSVPCADMTEANGWRYVGRGKAPEPNPVTNESATEKGTSAKSAEPPAECPHDHVKFTAAGGAVPVGDGANVEVGVAVRCRCGWTAAGDVRSGSREMRREVARAHAGGIVEGLHRADGIIRSMGRRGDLTAEHLATLDLYIRTAVNEAMADASPADRQPHVDRAALLDLATWWEARAAKLSQNAADSPSGLLEDGESRGLRVAALALKSLLDAPRGPGGGERSKKATAARESDRRAPSTHGGRAPESVQQDAPTVNGAEPPSDPLDPYRAKASAEQRAACLHPPDDRHPLSGDGWMCGLCGADCAHPEALAEEITEERLEAVEKRARLACDGNAGPGEAKILAAAALALASEVRRLHDELRDVARAMIAVEAPAELPGLVYEVQPHRTDLDTWVVEAIDHESEGEIYAAHFSGPGAEVRARAYARWASALGADDRPVITDPEEGLKAWRDWGKSVGAVDSAPGPARSEAPAPERPLPEAGPVRALLEAAVAETRSAAPDREQLGRETYNVWVEIARSLFCVEPSPGGWGALPERNREMNRIVGERLFNLGARWAERVGCGPAQNAMLDRVRAAFGAGDGELTLRAAERVRRERDESKLEAEKFGRLWEDQGARLHELEAADWASRFQQARAAVERLEQSAVEREAKLTEMAAELERVRAQLTGVRPPLPVASLVDAVLDVVTDHLDLPGARAPRLRADLLCRLRGELAHGAAPDMPKLYPVTGAVAELAGRIERIVVEAFSQPADGERRGPGVARDVLRAVDEYLRVTATRANGAATADAMTGLDAGGGP